MYTLIFKHFNKQFVPNENKENIFWEICPQTMFMVQRVSEHNVLLYENYNIRLSVDWNALWAFVFVLILSLKKSVGPWYTNIVLWKHLMDLLEKFDQILTKSALFLLKKTFSCKKSELKMF